jgi:hypothetical protein
MMCVSYLCEEETENEYILGWNHQHPTCTLRILLVGSEKVKKNSPLLCFSLLEKCENTPRISIES